ncbi:MAG TPA: glycosyltransferase [Pseudomonadales bacterium]|nr:glycosyltransferase [Pseudomonadales bacterium]HNL32765.1 glycosyltransferase [Pseudomonadales bacterium]
MADAVGRRPAILVLSSTFPRWPGDHEPPFVLELSRRLAERFDVWLLAPHAPGARRQEQMAGIEVERFRYAPDRLEQLAYQGGILARLKQQPWRWLLVPLFITAQWWALHRLLRRQHFDAIHSHWLIPQTLIALLAGAGRKAPLLCTSHGGDLFGLRAAPLPSIKAGVLKRCSAVTVVSRAMRDEVQRLLPGQMAEVVPMGTDLTGRFTPGSDSARRGDTLLFVGRLVEKKGVNHLLDALAQLQRQGRQLQLWIVGQGPGLEPLQAQTERLGLAAWVTFWGAVEHARLADFYRLATLAVTPSVVAEGGDQEGFGLVIVEAMGCGCPVVASALPAIGDIVIDGETGLLVPPADPTALAHAIGQLLDQPEQARRLATTARQRVVERFDWQQVTERYADLLLRMIERNERPA